jgi:hypothetical protein
MAQRKKPIPSADDLPPAIPLDRFLPVPSVDGRELWSETVPEIGKPLYLVANRMQVGSSVIALLSAARVMAHRAGRGLDSELADAWYIHPNVRLSTFSVENGVVRMVLTCDRGLVFPIVMPVSDWDRIVEIIQALIALGGR